MNDQQFLRPINWAALVETTLLAGTATVLLAKAAGGVLTFYIHPRYTPLVVVCGIVLLLVAGARLRALFTTPEPLSGRRLGYGLLLVPVLLGTLVPARSLGAGALGSGALNADLAASAVTDGDTSGWNLLQWATATSVRDNLGGKPADVVGFVYRDPQRPLDGFFVARYVVTCCAADGAGVGMPVVWAEGAQLKPDSWVRVRGTLGNAPVGGRDTPAIVAQSVELVPQPQPPYLYP